MVDEKAKKEETPKQSEIKPEAKPKAKELSVFKVGDTVRVYVRIKESEDKFRLQPFEGLVIRRRGSGVSQTFTVRKISYGEGVERIFPSHSPNVDKVEVVRKGKTKKAKLYFMRSRRGKAYKVEEERA